MGGFELLHRALVGQRTHVLAAVDGLDDEQLTSVVTPSGWTPAGLVSHLALDVERLWFREVFAGETVDHASDPESSWSVAAGRGLAALGTYREQCALADQAIIGHDLTEEPAWWPGRWGEWRLHDLGELLMHVIVETAQHAGHLDIVRERMDGTQHLVVE